MEILDADTITLNPVTNARAHRFIARLIWLYGACTVIVGIGLLLAVPLAIPFPQLHAQALEMIASGAAGLVLSVLLMTLTILAGTFALNAARWRYAITQEVGGDSDISSRFSIRKLTPGVVARQGQAVIICVGGAAALLVSYVLWPKTAMPPAPLVNTTLLGAIAVAFGFASLIGERMMAAFPAPLMPEAPALRRLLLLTTALLGAAGALEICRGAGLQGWTYWLFMALSALPWAILIELGLRSLARLFLPPPVATEARAVADSLLLAAVTGKPRPPSVLIREHLGLDFTRSWALRYLMGAALPAVFATLLLCWLLSGLKLIGLGERGVYERFGAPVAVLGPGIHLLPPWPLGIMRPVEYGTLHEIAVGTAGRAETMQKIAAEAIPPASSNHLWDTADPNEVEYLVASENGVGTQGFQTVSAEVRVLYRTGLTDNDALQSVYGTADPLTLVSQAGSRVVSTFFASHTLDQVMGERRETIAESLRSALAKDIATQRVGVEILTVLIEALHPPAGAAVAYHGVQAAEINARTSIANEQGRAERMASQAQQEAHQQTTAAEAIAEEKISQAKGEAAQFLSDRAAHSYSPISFLMERRFRNLAAALGQVKLTIVDDKLTAAQAPIIDSRVSGPPRTAPAAGGTAVPAAPPPSAAPPATPGIELEAP